jgi:hypothetical protein
MDKLYQDMVEAIKADAERYVADDDYDEGDAYLAVEDETESSISVYDDLNDERDHRYTIMNPKFLNEDVVKSKIVTTTSLKRECNLDVDAIAKWICSELPQETYLTLNKLVLMYDEEEDFDELAEDDEFGDAFDSGSYWPDDGMLGITWWEFSICVVNVKSIIKSCFKHELVDEQHPLRIELNRQIFATIAHEFRHLAQANPYLPEEVFDRIDDDNEVDAEEFAHDIVSYRPLGYCLLDEKVMSA